MGGAQAEYWFLSGHNQNAEERQVGGMGKGQFGMAWDIEGSPSDSWIFRSERGESAGQSSMPGVTESVEEDESPKGRDVE